jgi:hypothetical protein
MSTIQNIWREYIYDKIKENRNKYFVEYSPINLKSNYFAELNIVFTTDMGKKQIISIMKNELELWISRFPLPIKVSAFNEKGDLIYLREIKNNNSLFGYLKNGDINKSWDSLSKEDIPPEQLKKKYINKIYKDLSYTKRSEKEKKVNEKLKEKRNIKRFLDLSLILWLITSVIIAVLSWLNFSVGAIAFLFSIYQAIRRFLRLKGYKTKKEQIEQEKLRKMKHYYYHCERNPESFRRLKSENFEKEQSENIKKEKENIIN